MVAQENEDDVHIRPACAECTHRCNRIHGDRDVEEEKFDPDRRLPHFGKRVTKMALHYSPQAALCIPGTFMEDYPHSFPKDKPITLKGPSGNLWTVGATDRTCLHAGWPAFAYDHHLREGDYLDFRLTEPSHLIVEIFNSHGDVRRSARKATVSGKYATPSPLPLMQGHLKKRKVDMAELAGIGKHIMSNVVDRWNTHPPAKRVFTSFKETAAKLRFSEETKEWESHEEKNGREDQVVTIDLESDDEMTPARAGKLGHLLGQMGKEGDEDYLSPQSKAFATTWAGEGKKVVDAKSLQVITSDCEDDYIVQENEPFDDEAKQRTSDDPLRQFSNIFNTTRQNFLEDLQETKKGTVAEEAVVKNKMERKFESPRDPLSRAAQILCDDCTVMMKEEENEEEHSELDKTTPLACEAAAADNEPVTAHNAVDSSPVTLRLHIREMSEMHGSGVNSTAEDVNGKHNENYPSPGQMEEEEEGFFIGLSPENDVEYPVVINSIDGVQTDSKPPLKQGLKQAGDEETFKQTEDDEQDLIESKTSYSIFEAHELDVTMTEPGLEKEENPKMPDLGENMKEKETILLQSTIASPEFATPGKEMNINIQAKDASTTNTCVLGSKRWKVLPFDREKALKAAEAWVQNTRNPNFTTVMTRSQVYADFIMDIPADFAKQSNLPFLATPTRVTLVCDEVPTNCKALWLGPPLSQLDCRGWRNFSRSHCLEEGDVCVFECFPPATTPSTTITAASIRLGVFIFRVTKLTRPVMRDWTQHYKVLQGDDDDDDNATAGKTTTAANAGSPAPSTSPSPSAAQAQAQVHTPNGSKQTF